MASEPTEPETEIIDAYSLLSKPTLDITDAEAELIIEDLRKRRKAYVATGKVDKPKAAAAARKTATKDDKAANTAALLATLQLKMPGQS